MQNYLVISKKSSTFAPQFSYELIISRSRAVVARQAHNLKVVGSIPSSATTEKAAYQSGFFVFHHDPILPISALVCPTCRTPHHLA